MAFEVFTFLAFMDFCRILVLVLLNACLEENIVRFDQYSSEDSLLDIGLKKKRKVMYER